MDYELLKAGMRSTHHNTVGKEHDGTPGYLATNPVPPATASSPAGKPHED